MNENALILVVDGDPHLLHATSRVLKKADYEVLEAGTGTEGLRLAKVQKPELIVLDAVLPDIDGIEVCRRVKGEPALASCLVVLLSGVETSSDDRATGLEAGADEYIARPISDRELLARVEAMLRIKQVEKALRESEARFTDLFEKAPLGYQSLDGDGHFLMVNEAWLETLGYTREEVIGKWFGDFLAPEFVEAFRSRFAAFEAVGRMHSEFEMIHKSGERRLISFEGRIVYRSDGSFERTHCILQDITERKRAEEALREQHSTLHSIIDSADALIFSVDRQYRYTSFNEGHAAIMKAIYGAEIKVGHSLLDYMTVTEDRETAKCNLDRALAGEQLVEEAYSGEELRSRRYFQVSYSPIKTEEGQVIGVAVLAQDMTERKQAEEALRSALVELTVIHQNVPIAMMLVDHDRRVRKVNEAASLFAGRPREEMLSLRAGEALRCLHHLDDPRGCGFGLACGTCAVRLTVLDTFTTRESRRDVEAWMHFPRGDSVEEICLLVSTAYLQTDDTEQVLICAQDITERKRVENIMQARLRLLEFASSHSTDELLTATLDEIEALTGSSIGFYHFLEVDQRTLSLQSWSTNTLKSMCTAEGKGSHYDVAQAGVWVDCVYERRPVIHNDYASLPHRKGMPEGHAPVVREVVVPIFRGELIKAIIGVGNKPTPYNESDVEIVSQLGDLSWDITERKRTEEALKEQFSTLRSIIDSANALIFSVDRQYRYSSFNEGHAAVMQALYGAEIETGHSLLDYMTVPEDRETARGNLDRALAGEQLVEEAYSGEELRSRQYFQVSHSPIETEEGQVIGVAVLAQDMTERKRAEEALRESEKRVRRKLDAVLSPEADISALELADIIDSEKVQKLMDEFYRLTNVGIGIIDLHGRVLVGTGWQDICTEFHRVNPESCRLCIESDLELSSNVPVGTFKQYRCKNNMWDIATPIMLGDRHVGNIFLGQFLFDDETPDYEVFRQQARRYGFNEQEYIAALDRVPRWSREMVNAAMSFYAAFAGMIGHLSYGNIKLANALEERKRTEDKLRQSEHHKTIQNQIANVFLTVPDEEMYAEVLAVVLRAMKSEFGIFGFIEANDDLVIPSLTRGIWDECQVPDKSIVFPPDTWGDSLWGRAIREKNASYSDGPFHTPAGHVHIDNFLTVPIVFGNETIGLISCANSEQGYTEETKDSLEDIAGYISPILNARLQRDRQAQERKQAEETLRASEERFSKAFRLSPMGMAIFCASDGRFVDVNDAFTQISGYSREEIIGCTVLELQLYANPKERDSILRTLQERGRLDKFEFRARMKSGEIRDGLSATTEIDLGGEKHYLSLILDITERRRAEEELRAHRDRLEELVRERTAELTIAKDAAEEAQRLAEAASQAKSTFLANMSHELRTPLNAILGYAQILQRRPLDTDVINALNTVQRSGEHLLTLINDILDIARIEAGRLELFPTPIHFPGFLDHIASIIRSRAEAKGLSFTFEKSSAIPVGVQADETRLRQVLLNLLDNAVKFTDQGEVVLSVGVCEYESEAPPHPHTPTLRFSVRDTGVGIPPDQLERIFQPFEQVGHATRWTSGTGLGLAISHQLVHLMGGDLQVESQVDRGSTFWFEIGLPMTEMAVEVAQPPERAITGYRGPRRTVLVVDDVPSSRAILVDLLQPLGFEVVEAADGQQALHLAQELRPDLILMDRWMPGLDGFEAAQRMRQIPELREVPIVTVSASVSNEDQAQSREVGIDAFLPKPVSWPRLAALLQKCLALEWEYEKTIEVGEEEGEAVLVPPPAGEMEILLDLARRGNMRAILERTAHIETLGEQYVPFARGLHELAESFEERQIRTLIERYMEKDQ